MPPGVGWVKVVPANTLNLRERERLRYRDEGGIINDELKTVLWGV